MRELIDVNNYATKSYMLHSPILVVHTNTLHYTINFCEIVVNLFFQIILLNVHSQFLTYLCNIHSQSATPTFPLEPKKNFQIFLLCEFLSFVKFVNSKSLKIMDFRRF